MYAKLLYSLWRLTVEIVVYIMDNVPSKSVLEMSYELCKGHIGSLCHFKIWGYLAHLLVQNPKKLKHRSIVGYSKEKRCGLFYDPQENSVFMSTLL